MGRTSKLIFVNSLTLLRFVFAGFVVYLALNDYWLAIVILVPLILLTDKLDGTLARRWQVVSTFGKAADPLADKALTLVLLYIIVSYYDFSWVYLGLAVLMLLFDIGVVLMSISAREKTGDIIEPTKAGKYRMAIYMSSIAIMISGIVFTDVTNLGGILRVVGLTLSVFSAGLTLFVFKDYFRMYREESRKLKNKT